MASSKCCPLCGKGNLTLENTRIIDLGWATALGHEKCEFQLELPLPPRPGLRKLHLEDPGSLPQRDYGDEA